MIPKYLGSFEKAFSSVFMNILKYYIVFKAQERSL